MTWSLFKVVAINVSGLGCIQILYLKALHLHGKPTQVILIILAG